MTDSGPMPPHGPEHCTDSFIRGSTWYCRRCRESVRVATDEEKAQDIAYKRWCEAPRDGSKTTMVLTVDGLDEGGQEATFEIGRFVKLTFKDGWLIGHRADGCRAQLGMMTPKPFWAGGCMGANSGDHQDALTYEFEIRMEH